MGKCIIKDCPAHKDDVSLFILPKNNPVQRQQWLQAAQLEDDFKKQKPQICSFHFRPEDFVRDLKAELMPGIKARKILRQGAVPTLFVPGVVVTPPAPADQLEQGLDSSDFGHSVFGHFMDQQQQQQPTVSGYHATTLVNKGQEEPSRPTTSDKGQSFDFEEHEKILNSKVPKLIDSNQFVLEPAPAKRDEKVMYYVYKEPKYVKKLKKQQRQAAAAPAMKDAQTQVKLKTLLYKRDLRRALSRKNAKLLQMREEIQALKRDRRKLKKELEKRP